MNALFSLAYTSVRKEKIKEVIDLWLKTSSGNYPIEIVVSVDGDKAACIETANNIPGVLAVIQAEGPFNSTRGWNAAAAMTTGKVIICVSDDFKPCQNWDQLLFELNGNNGAWMDEDWIVHTKDGYVEDIAVASILTRARYNRFGYVFYPQYQSLFSDTEFTAVAYKEGRVIKAKHIFIEHMHPDCGKRERDHHDHIHASPMRWQHGETLFNFRKAKGFPVDDGPLAQAEQTPQSTQTSNASASQDFCMYMQANADDFCLNEVCRRMYDEGIRDFFFCFTSQYWSGKPSTDEGFAKVSEAAKNISNLGARATVKIFDVDDYRFPGDTRITVETRVRNDALCWVRSQGFTRICVVDSDELWPHGTLDLVKNIVANSNPLAISLPMVPVVGFPGYPIDGAKDRVISYVGRDCALRDCRTPVGEVFYENKKVVYHFTSIRRGKEATIQKHRESGHFDDPEYEFEWWINNVLPNIKPGFQPKWPDGRTGIHMYKRYQIWPSIRDWTSLDFNEIPTSLWQFLGDK
jgi:hypothetical protein